MKNIFYFFIIILIVMPSPITSQSRHPKPQTPIREPRNNLTERTNPENRKQSPAKPKEREKENPPIIIKVIEDNQPVDPYFYKEDDETILFDGQIEPLPQEEIYPEIDYEPVK